MALPSISELFDEWAAAERLSGEACDDDDEIDRRADAAYALADQLALAPAGNLADFARKVVLLIYDLLPSFPGDDSDDPQATMLRAVLADALRLAPDMHPPFSIAASGNA
jgi:hypothetical protein